MATDLIAHLGALLLLCGSLLAFLLSTRQARLWARAVAWAGGAACVCGAGLVAFGGWDGVREALADAGSRQKHIVFMQALLSNREVIAGIVKPIVQGLIPIVMLVGVLAVVAFTPGEAVERVLRPFGVLVLGGALGAAATLAVVAIGYGAYSKRSVYVGALAAGDVIDGDTFRIGDFRFRLAGVDALEGGQVCVRDGVNTDCGARARLELVRLTRGALLRCSHPNWLSGEAIAGDTRLLPDESFGRPIVACRIFPADGGAPFDLGGRMISSGWAVRYLDDQGAYDGVRSSSREFCTLRPDVWRRGGALREDFIQFGRLPADPDETVGDACEALRRQQNNPDAPPG